MKLIVGLGNPGDSYEETRHNIGFMVVDKLAKELVAGPVIWNQDMKHRAYVAKADGVILVKPLTFMNNSGEAIGALAKYYKIASTDVILIHDELDLPIGKIKIRKNGSSAGHNGVQSVIDHLKTDEFIRVRLGIGQGQEESHKQGDRHTRHQGVINFVLSRFGQNEAGEMRKLIKYGTEAVQLLLTDGIERAMNRFN